MRAMRRILRGWTRFGRARDGAAAIEFGLVAVPFFLLLVGLAEITVLGFAQTTLDFAVSESARRIRTGEVQANDETLTDLRADICETITTFVGSTCQERLFFEVDRFDSFVEAANPAAIADIDFNQANMAFDPGNASDIVVVRAYYRWSIITPLFSGIFQNDGDGDRMLISTMLFRNEPFPEDLEDAIEEEAAT